MVPKRHGGPLFDGQYFDLNTYGNKFVKSVADLTGSFETPSMTSFSPDGTRAYLVEGGGRKRSWQFNCSTPFQTSDWVQQATLRQPGFITEGSYISIKNDGTRVFWSGPEGFCSYDIGTPWELHLGGLTNLISLSKPAAHGTVRSFTLNDEGDTIIAADSANGQIHKYTLSTPYDVSTGTIVQSVAIPGPATNEDYLWMGPDGLRLFITGTVACRAYSLSAAYDLSTLVDLGQTVDTRSGGTNQAATGLSFSSDMKYMFFTSMNNDSVGRRTAS